MHRSRGVAWALRVLAIGLLASAFVALAVSAPASASSFETIWTFTNTVDGRNPGNLTYDGTGPLYGVTAAGGRRGGGTVFQLVKAKHKLNVLHAFSSSRLGSPDPTTLIFGSDGTIYGSTDGGNPFSDGTIFRLVSATRTFTPLADFPGIPSTPCCGFFDERPSVGVVLANSQTIYGTTLRTVSSEFGTLFKLALGNPVRLTTLYRFTEGLDGYFPNPPLILANNVLYGTTQSSVFKFDLATMQLAPVYFFGLGAGPRPPNGLVFRHGMLFGTLQEYSSSCPSGCGAIFKLDPTNGALTTLHSFDFRPAEVHGAPGALVVDAVGTIYGITTSLAEGDFGSVYRLDPTSGKLTALHIFTGRTDGAYPTSLVEHDGALFGTTAMGGGAVTGICGVANNPPGCGTIFRLLP